jgi:hypothetical protein
MLGNLNMHIEIYLFSWSFDSGFFSGMAYVYFIYRIYEHPSCFAYYVNPTFRLVYIGVIFISHELIITCIFIYVRVCLFYAVHTLNSVTKRSNTVTRGWGIDLKTNREGLKKKIDVNFYLSVLFCFRICTLYVVNPLASHVSFYLYQKWIHISICTHIFNVNENLERFLHVGNILSIKAYFWGSWNFYYRWTLVMCRVDSNWTSDGLGLGLGDIKVNEISKCTK